MNRYKQHSIHFLKHITIALIIALGAIGITSCSTDDDTIVDLPNESAAVLFHTVVDKDIQTRGASMDNDALKSESFGVLAYYTQNSAWNAAAASATPNFMYNQKVAWSTTNTTWNYSPMKYWPNNTNDKVSFFAYAPYEETPATGANKGIKLSSNTTNDTPAIDFTVNSNITNQVDLVYASAKDKNKELVDFQFKHALSRIGFSAKAAADYGDTKIVVKNVAIKGKFYPTGTFTFSNLSNDGSWGNFGAPATTGITYTPGLNSKANALETFVQRINEDNQHIMVIPQNFEEANKFAIETTYTTVVNGVESPNEKVVSEDINLNFEQGKAYNITLNISLSLIEISVEVSDWEDEIEISDVELGGQNGEYGPYKLGVSQGAFIFTPDARVPTSTDNKLSIYTNYPTGWEIAKIVDANNVDINSTTNSNGWLELSPNSISTVGTNVTTLELKANNGSNRVGFIHISAGRLTYVVKVEQEGRIKPEANSYIVAPNSGKIYIPVLRANQSTLGNQLTTGNVFTAELVWTDNSNKIAPNSNIKSISVEGTGPTGLLVIEPGSAEGNAVVAIKNASGKILWSWHIWVTDYAPTFTGPGSFMDRNLGAMSNTPGNPKTHGLMYQWGRKDPFPGSTEKYSGVDPTLYTTTGTIDVVVGNVQSNNLANAFANPLTYYVNSSSPFDWYRTSAGAENNKLWDPTIKSVYDPCPPGWRVPKTTSVWEGLNNTNYIWNHITLGRTNDSYGGFYPGAGRRGNDNSTYQSVGSGGRYWSSEANATSASVLEFDNGNLVNLNPTGNYRAHAASVRCVRE